MTKIACFCVIAFLVCISCLAYPIKSALSTKYVEARKDTYTDMTKPGTFSVAWTALGSKEVDRCFKDAVSLDLSQGGTTMSSNGIVVGNGAGGAIDG